MEVTRKLINAGLAVVMLGVGVGGALWLVRTRPSPPLRTGFLRTSAVAVMPVVPRVEATPIIGFGTVRPKNQVSIVPQVNGQLVHTHKQLAQGNVIETGEVLFQIDDTIYQARVKQAEAEIAGLDAALARHRQEIADLDERIATMEELLEIEKRSYERDRKLFEEEDVGTQSQLDVVYEKYLRQRDVVAELKNRQALGPHIEAELASKLEAAKANLTQAQHHLESTRIPCPFRARVESNSAYKSQVVTAHLSIATLTDMEALELSVGVDPRDLQWLAEDIQPAALADNDEDDMDGSVVRVSSSLPGRDAAWNGRVTRFERVDETTRTARLVVEVRDLHVTIGSQDGDTTLLPELSIGMHCRADLPVRPLEGALLVPRHALHDQGWVYVFEPDANDPSGRRGRLGTRAVTSLRSMGSAVLVDYLGRQSPEPCELRAGDRIIVSPLPRAVVGMEIEAREAKDMQSTADWRVALFPLQERLSTIQPRSFRSQVRLVSAQMN